MADTDFIAFDPSASSSSSRKPRERNNPDRERVNTTVFISSLPYNATSTDLLTHFSFIGPVRHGFVATEKESGKSKGVGYVTYSLKEDAERAIEELNNGAFGDKGRKIKVTWATERPGLKERNNQEPKPVKVARGRDDNDAEEGGATRPKSDPNALRTLVLTGLPKDLTKAVLWKKVRKVADGIELVYPVEGQEDTAHLLFPHHNDAFVAVKKLHGHTYKGSLLSCVLKKRLDKLVATEGHGPSHAGRLIVRNLSWDTTEQDLRATFLPYGPIHSIDLPTLPSKLPPSSDPSKPAPPPRARGFAFVWFIARKDAESAIEGVNGKAITRAAGKEKEGKESRVVAVDFALSKEKWSEAQKQVEAEKPAKEDASDHESSSSGSSDDEDDSSEGEEEDEQAEDGGDDAAAEEAEEEPVKPQLPAVDVGSTLFIRNLPFETTEEELGALFRQFGPMRYARITIDKATGRSRGSGFVCYWKTESADQAIEEAKKVLEETGANAMPLGGKNPFALPTVLTADPSSSLVSRLVLHGRTLDVTRAVTREEAGNMKEDGERARTAGDKRNTYLMREGVIFPNSPAAAALPPAEIQKRQDAFNARKTLLKSNPSLYISKTRLSIRQLPLFATDRVLKRLAIHATREFDAEVAAGDREAFTRIEESDETISPAAKAKKRGERITPVVQSKIVRQTEKIDPLLNVGRSRGYGFLEMRTHKDALKVLRWANNNPEVGKLMAEWWLVELKDILDRTKKILEQKRAAQNGGGVKAKKAKAKAAKGDGSDEDDDDDDDDDEAEEESEAQDEDVKMKEEKKDGDKAEKIAGDKGESIEDLEARVRKLESRVAEGGERDVGMRGGKTLLIEFSVENVQVVRRRGEKIQATRDGGPLRPQQRGGNPNNHRGQNATAAVDSEDEGDKAKAGAKKGGRPDMRFAKKDDGAATGGKRERGGKRKNGDGPGGNGDGSDGNKRQRSDAVPAAGGGPGGEKRGLEKMGSHLGSLIGRKRKQRMGK